MMNKNTKASLFMIWDWIKEFKLLIIPFIGIALSNIFCTVEQQRYIYEIGALSIMVLMAIGGLFYLLYRIEIYFKTKKLKGKLLADWEERKDFIEKRYVRQKAKYLRGEPVTIIDKKGNVKIIQQGKEIVISTPN